MAIIAFAGLALAGSALAATGVWNPLAGGERPRVEHPARSGGAIESEPLSESDVTHPSRSHQQVPRQPPRAEDRRAKAVTPVGVQEPLIPKSDGEPVVDPPSGAEGGSSNGFSAGRDSHPKVSGGTGDGGQPRGEEPGRGESPPKEQPNQEGPSPHPSQTAFSCGPTEPKVGQTASCTVKVFGEGGPPTGQVDFQTAGAGSFSSGSCTLAEVTGSSTSACSVEYTPRASGAHQLTSSYGGDVAHTPISGSFVLTVVP
jgi:hypothetical protein